LPYFVLREGPSKNLPTRVESAGTEFLIFDLATQEGSPQLAGPKSKILGSHDLPIDRNRPRNIEIDGVAIEIYSFLLYTMYS
jgi:hypothetical protein